MILLRLDYIDNCDCLEGLKEIPDKSVDCVITDPPYGLGIRSMQGSKLNPWADICNASLWYREWMSECKRVLKDNGSLWSFINWRYFTTLYKAGLDINWSPESVLIWDKCWIGPGGKKGLRPSYEQVVLYANDDFTIKNRGLPDIQRFKWSSHKPNGHPAEKPLDLICWVIDACSLEPGAVVLDPFMGSGTTAHAAVLKGCHYVGFEMDPNWHAIATKRVESVTDELLGL